MEIKIKTPGKDAIDHLKAHWKPIGLYGEFEFPIVTFTHLSRDQSLRCCTLDEKKISHHIKSIRWDTYDDETKSIVADIDFVGPYASLAISLFLKDAVRFASRYLVVKNLARIITWDIITKPDDINVKEAIRTFEMMKRKPIVKPNLPSQN
jgi:hypothetical protein